MDVMGWLQWLQRHSLFPVMAIFLALVVVAYLPRRRQEMERNARIPLDDDR